MLGASSWLPLTNSLDLLSGSLQRDKSNVSNYRKRSLLWGMLLESSQEEDSHSLFLIHASFHLPAVLVARVVTEGLGVGQRCLGKALLVPVAIASKIIPCISLAHWSID